MTRQQGGEAGGKSLTGNARLLHRPLTDGESLSLASCHVSRVKSPLTTLVVELLTAPLRVSLTGIETGLLSGRSVWKGSC